MLVVERRLDEVVIIGPDIEVMIVGVRSDRVRLGIKAPRSVAVHRKEVADKIARGTSHKPKVN